MGRAIEENFRKFVVQRSANKLSFENLAAVDLDDTFEYFKVMVIKLTIAKKLAAYPNASAGDQISFSNKCQPY